jgi:hypothetical protein
MKTLLCFFTLLFSSIGHAQEINVLVTDIREERTLDQHYSALELTVKINGIQIDENRQVKVGKITSAVDNLGNTLEEKTSSFGYDFKDRNEVSFKLNAPPRSATQLNTIEGIIHYYVPTLENKGKVEIVNPLDKYNTNLLKGITTDAKIILIDDEGLKKLKSENEAAFNQQMDKLKKDNAIEEKMGGLLTGFKDFFEGLFNYGSYGPSLNFYVEDTDDKIIGINVYNDNGDKVSNGYFSSGNQMTITLNDEPKDSWKIAILMENEKALKEYKFKLTNVFLP